MIADSICKCTFWIKSWIHFFQISRDICHHLQYIITHIWLKPVFSHSHTFSLLKVVEKLQFKLIIYTYTVHVVTNPSADIGTLLLEKSCHFFFSNSGVKVFHMTPWQRADMVGSLPAADSGHSGAVAGIWWWVGSCSAAPQSLPVWTGNNARDKLVREATSHFQFKLLPWPVVCVLICHLHSDKHNIQQYHLNCCLLMYTYS